MRVKSPDSTVPRDTDFQEGFSVQLRLARHQGRLCRSPYQDSTRPPQQPLATARLRQARRTAAARATPKRSQRWSSWPASCAVPIRIVGRFRCGRFRPPLRGAATSRLPAGPTKRRPWRQCSVSVDQQDVIVKPRQNVRRSISGNGPNMGEG
jgi:hypothetical protein